MSLSGKTAYFPVESLVGLGHFNRTGKIVQELVKAGMDTTVASGTFVDRERFFPGAQLKEMPPHVFNSGDYAYTLESDGKRKILSDFNAAAHSEARTNAHLSNIAAAAPDVLITEFWPFDRPQFDKEMITLLAATEEAALHKKCTRIVSVRDVLNSKDAVKSVNVDSDGDGVGEEVEIARDEWAARMINSNYDAVLVHGDRRFVDLSGTFKAADKITKDVIYTGYVINDLPQRVTPDVMNGPVVVSCGSGASAHDMILAFMNAWQKLIERSAEDRQAAFVTSRPLHIVCGPRFMNEYYNEVVEWAQILQEKSGFEIKVDKYRPDLTSMLATASFSVSLAGYNTTLETLALDMPALFVPHYVLHHGKMNINPEQIYRLKRLEHYGMASFAPPQEVENSDLFAARILHEFMRQTSEQRKPEFKLDFSGAENTIKAVDKILQKGPAVRC